MQPCQPLRFQALRSGRLARCGLARPGWVMRWLLGWMLMGLSLSLGLVVAPAWAGAGAGGASGPQRLMGGLDDLEHFGRIQPEAVVAEVEQRLAEPSLTAAQHLDLLRVLGNLRARQQQREAGLQVAERLEQLVLPDARLQADAQVAAACLRADLERIVSPLARVDAMLEDILPQFNALTSPLTVASCLGLHATVKEGRGQFDAALRLSQDALRAAAVLPVWRRVEQSTALAYTLYRAGQLDRAFEVNAEARRAAKDSGDPLLMSQTATTEGILLTNTGRDTEELQSMIQAIEYARQAGAVREEALGLANLSDYYLRSADYNRAYELAQRALPMAVATHHPGSIRVAKINSGLALISMHRKVEGLKLLREVITQLRASDEVVELSEVLRDLGRYLEAAGYYGEALEAYRDDRHLSDEVFRRDRQREVLELQESFESERRRAERALLLDDNQIKEEVLRQRELQFRLWALGTGVAVLLLAALVLWYLRIRATQQTLKTSTESLRQQSERDPLTGAANRRYFEQHVAGLELHGTLCMLDLDHFKQINDEHGHASGDVVLIDMAARLRSVLRGDDLVVRWGGEEFLVWTAATEQADRLAQRLLEALARQPVQLAQGVRLKVTASLGFAAFPLAPARLDLGWPLAVELVDAAMYIAKVRGRNRAIGLEHLDAPSVEAVKALLKDLDAAERAGQLGLVEWDCPVGDTQPAEFA